MVAQLDLTTLRSAKDTFVDSELRDHFSDLLYEIRLKDKTPAYIYLLFEHKSYPAPWVAFQLLRYMLRIWEHVFEQQDVDTLPPIVPLVVYHGESRWQVDRRFSKLVTACPPLANYIPDFSYELCDLSTYSDEDLVGAVHLQVTLLLMKHIFDGTWHATLPSLMRLMAELARTENSLTYVETALRYMAAAARSLERDELDKAVKQTFPETGGALMQTIAQEWIQEGVEKATREAVLELLEVRFGRTSAAVLAGLARIEDLARLKALHRQAVVVSSLDEFEALLAQSPDGNHA